MNDAERLDREAAAWVARLHSDQQTTADQEAFARWIASDPACAEAYAEHSALWASVGALSESEEARALLWVRRRRLWTRWRAAGAAAALAAAAILAVMFLPRLGWDSQFRTRPGGLQTVTLADGSAVTLDTDTAVRIRLMAGERRVLLERGRAYFHVAKDPARPFRVFVGRDEVRAVGTAFDVSKVGDGAQVLLEEGRVAIFRSVGPPQLAAAVRPPAAGRSDGSGRAPDVTLDAGEQAVLNVGAAPVVTPADVPRVSAWRYGRLVLDDQRLAEVVKELNRYGEPRVVLSDPALGEMRVSGVFHTGRPHDVVAAVSAAFPVRVVRDDASEIVLAPR